jgi:hypothetical protein
LVQGIGGYLMSTYARGRHETLTALRRRADLSAGILLAVALTTGAVAVWALPVLGPVLTGGQFTVAATAVWGWVLYAAAAAVVAPYSSLAAVRGRQPVVFALRVADALLAFSVLAALLAAGAGAIVMPFALALGSLLGAVFLRWRVLGGSDRGSVPAQTTDRDDAAHDTAVDTHDAATPGDLSTATPPDDRSTTTITTSSAAAPAGRRP